MRSVRAYYCTIIIYYYLLTTNQMRLRVIYCGYQACGLLLFNVRVCSVRPFAAVSTCPLFIRYLFSILLFFLVPLRQRMIRYFVLYDYDMYSHVRTCTGIAKHWIKFVFIR